MTSSYFYNTGPVYLCLFVLPCWTTRWRYLILRELIECVIRLSVLLKQLFWQYLWVGSTLCGISALFEKTDKLKKKKKSGPCCNSDLWDLKCMINLTECNRLDILIVSNRSSPSVAIFYFLLPIHLLYHLFSWHLHCYFRLYNINTLPTPH